MLAGLARTILKSDDEVDRFSLYILRACAQTLPSAVCVEDWRMKILK